ncbi:hypothetical protein EYF80_041986 [Liparis tanakae]|uniref:Uncharacterized protein n=1 Tax=Liparis tanakae TaxID=230148 RepID=A0A4Z2G4N0_9TELE|nr:hypothetical protein EYF80_041986 [Liparis tanakae]
MCSGGVFVCVTSPTASERTPSYRHVSILAAAAGSDDLIPVLIRAAGAFGTLHARPDHTSRSLSPVSPMSPMSPVSPVFCPKASLLVPAYPQSSTAFKKSPV